MSGEELKIKIQDCGISQSELARKLGMSQPLFSQALKAADIKSGFLEKIADAIGKDMSFFYSACGTVTTTGDNNTVQVGNGNCCMPTAKEEDDDEEIDLGLDDICDLKEEIKYLREQNRKLIDWLDRLMKKQ